MLLPFTSSPHSLCILRLSAIGDICHTLPVVRTLQAHWPETKLTWIIGKLEAGLVGDIPGIEFIIFDKSKGRTSYRDIKQQLKGRRFDALLHMQISIRSSRIARTISSPIKLGFDRTRAKDFQWLFTNHQIAAKSQQHVMDGLFGFTEALGVNERQLSWDIPLSGETQTFAASYIPDEKPTLIISPCTSSRLRNWRNWHAQGYAAVADYASKQHGLQVILTGGPTDIEQEYGEQITDLAHHKPINLIGQTSLKELFALLQRATVVISPDSGPAHMANAAGTPVIGLYVTSNPLRTGPYLNQKWVVNKYPEAIKQELNKEIDEVPWGRRVRNPEAMSLIRTEDVITKLDDLLTNL
jgi:heptosyltransferase I